MKDNDSVDSSLQEKFIEGSISGPKSPFTSGSCDSSGVNVNSSYSGKLRSLTGTLRFKTS